MADKYSKEKRFQIMSANRSRGNRSTERRLRASLVASGISGWRVNAADLAGTPDFVFDRCKVAIFVDGCFWHGCSCKHLPKTNRKFWGAKIVANQARDKKVTSQLRRRGWKVIRFWEHEVKFKLRSCVTKILFAVNQKAATKSSKNCCI